MRGLAVLLSICFGVAVAQVCQYDHGNGRPACIQAEMNRPWRNNWDPVHYWVCISLNSPAVAMRCPTNHGFLESALQCVPWPQWVWTPPCNPPSGGNNGGGGTVPPPIDPIPPGPPGPPAPPNQGCQYDHGNGRPACIQAEMNRPWRNNWDPVHYWVCISLNSPAVAMRCPTNHGFLESALQCVPWPQWVWTPPCNPPSGGNNGGGGGGTVPPPTDPITPGPPAPGPPGNGVCYYDHGNGRPLCNAQELNRPWRNNWDNTRYWVCPALNAPAVNVVCGVNTLFLEAALACVDVPMWQWTPPCNPPSTTR